MSLVVLPSISAIAIKLLIVWYGRNSIKGADKWLVGFLLGLFGVNFFELLSFQHVNNAEDIGALVVLSAFYIFAIICAVSYFSISLRLVGYLGSKVEHILMFAMGIAIISLIIPGAAIIGTESIGYSVTRIAGDWYWLIQLVIIGGVLGSLVTLFSQLWSKDVVKKGRSLALLLGTLPTAFCVVITMMLMQLGYKMNASIMLSLSINVMFAVLVFTETRHGLFRFLAAIPFTAEHKLSRELTRASIELTSNGLLDTIANIETKLIQDVLIKCGGNKTYAAEKLGISRTTLRRKLEK